MVHSSAKKQCAQRRERCSTEKRPPAYNFYEGIEEESLHENNSVQLTDAYRNFCHPLCHRCRTSHRPELLGFAGAAVTFASTGGRGISAFDILHVTVYIGPKLKSKTQCGTSSTSLEPQLCKTISQNLSEHKPRRLPERSLLVIYLTTPGENISPSRHCTASQKVSINRGILLQRIGIPK